MNKNVIDITSSSYIDKITIECMMNKKHYKSYLEKTNPTKLKESYELQNKIKKNTIFIETIFDELLENSKQKIVADNKYNYNIQKSFDTFIQHTLDYIEKYNSIYIETSDTINEIEDINEMEDINENNDQPINNYTKELSKYSPLTSLPYTVIDNDIKSVWGKSITKLNYTDQK